MLPRLVKLRRCLSVVKSNCCLFRHWALALLVMVCLAGLDQLTKQWALENLSQMNSPLFPYGGLEITRFSFAGHPAIDVALVLAFNTGAAWSFLENTPLLLIVIRLLLIIALFFWLWCSSPDRRWPVFLLLAGACSNLFDMLCRGAVIDMISLTFWGYLYPIFNMADIMICLGAFMFIVLGSKKGDAADVSNKHS
jgi:lipoprotein signal peptidase